MKPLVFVPVDSAKREIRLFDLHPGSDQDDISITLRHAHLQAAPEYAGRSHEAWEALLASLPPGWKAYETARYRYRVLFQGPGREFTWEHPDAKCNPSLWRELNEPPPPDFRPCYEAVSYTWGTVDSPEPINVQYKPAGVLDGRTPIDEYTMLVRQNLAAALRAMRYTSDKRTLWVDSICIDQSSVKERGHQVRLMDKIYMMAQRVLVWLGPSSPETQIAFKELRHLASLAEVVAVRWYRTLETPESGLWARETELPYSDATWHAIDELVHRPWFERLWVMQEVEVSNLKATAFCGRSEIEWEALRKALLCLKKKKSLPLVSLRSRLEGIDDIFRGLDGYPLTCALHAGRQRVCGVNRDHIYALFATEPFSELASAIDPDYSESTRDQDIFRDLILKCLELYGCLELLGECEDVEGDPGWPSWIPNWSIPRRTDPLAYASFACGMSRASAHVNESDPKILEVRGVEQATICRVHSAAPSEHGDVLKPLKDIIRGLAGRSEDRYPATDEPLLDAWCAVPANGEMKEKWAEFDYEYPSWDRWKALCLSAAASESGAVEPYDADRIVCQRRLQNRALFETAEGYIGMGPASIRLGDIISVILGCRAPMVLRPVAGGGGGGRFRVLGEAYAHGLGDAEALLGPLPRGWRVAVRPHWSSWEVVPMFRPPAPAGAAEQLQDPRLPPLSDGWEQTAARRHPNPRCGPTQYFRHQGTGEVVGYDPRMSVEALTARGVDIRTFSLI